MRLTLRQFQVFVAVADAGSTTAAGLQLALSQSATSSALSELESLLRVPLFDRVGKRLLLNDTGRALLPEVRTLLEGARSIERQFGIDTTAKSSASIRSQLRIGASTTIGNYLLPALIANYLKASSHGEADQTVEFVATCIGNTREIAAKVARMEVDVGLIEGPCPEPDLLVRPWMEDELVIVCAPSHPLLHPSLKTPVDENALRQARWLLREPGSGTREAVENAVLSHLHQWEQTMELGSTEAIKQAATEGLGLACLSWCAVQDLVRLRRLVVVSSVLPRLTRRFYLVSHRQKQFSACLQGFVDHCARVPTLMPLAY